MRLLCVASLTPRKGHDLLLRALAGLRAEPWHLDCVGSLDRNPAWAEGLIRLRDELGLAGRVSFPGTLGEEELEGRYGGADLFVLPSRFEGYGMVFAEALAHGLPILATRAGASGETVPPEAGLLVPADDPVALRQALRRLMADTALRGRLAKGARTAGICLPTWRDAVAAFAAALEEAVEKAGRAGRDEVPEQVGREAMGDTQGPAPRVVGDVMMNIIPAHDGMIQTMAEIAGPEVALDG